MQLKRISVVKAEGEKPHPTVVLPPLYTDREYYIVAEAVVDNGPDPAVRLSSERIRVPTGPHYRSAGKTPISKAVAPVRN